MRLEGKVAVVAAAGGGIGTAVPLLYAQEGAKVVLSARRLEPLEAIAAQIKEQGGEAMCVTADLVTGEGAQHLVDRTVETYGRVDVFYNNLGDSAGRGLRLHETPEDVWDFLTDINLKGHYQCARAVIPVMQRQGGGVIIHVAASADTRLRAHPGYAAGKAALIQLTQNMAREYRKENIRVVAISCPGPISRPPEAPIRPPDPKLYRMPVAEDVAYAALYLASDEAAWVSGSVLTVDGGGEVSMQSVRDL